MNTRAPHAFLFARGTQPPSGRLPGIAVTVALHVLAVLLLLQWQPVHTAFSSAVPIMVGWITLPVDKPNVLPKPPAVKPQARPRPVALPPVIAAPAEAPAPTAVSPAPPAPPMETAVATAPAPSAAQPATAPAPVTAPAPLVAPSFSASYLQNPPPAYPNLARRQGHQGKVVLRVLVSAAGAAEQIEVRSSSGHTALDRAALEAVKRWRFVPARQGDQPVAAWVLVPITFTLEG